MPEGPQVTMGDGGNAPPVLRRCDNPWKPNAEHGPSEVILDLCLLRTFRIIFVFILFTMEHSCYQRFICKLICFV